MARGGYMRFCVRLGRNGCGANGDRKYRSLVPWQRSGQRDTSPYRWEKDGWTTVQVSLLGTLPDDEVAARIGRSANAVRQKRERLRMVRVHPPSANPPT